MSSIIRFVYYLSIVVFIALLMFSYYQLPTTVAIGYSQNIEMKVYQTKEWYFYVAAGVFMGFNVVILMAKSVLKRFPYSYLPVINKEFWQQDTEHKEYVAKIYDTWVNSLAICSNAMLSYIVFSLYMINVLESGTFATYVPFVWVFMGIIAIWWVVLPIRFAVKNGDF